MYSLNAHFCLLTACPHCHVGFRIANYSTNITRPRLAESSARHPLVSIRVSELFVSGFGETRVCSANSAPQNGM